MNTPASPVPKATPTWKKWWVYPLLLLALALSIFALFRTNPPTAESDLASFLAAAHAGDLESVRVDSDGRHFTYRLHDDDTGYRVRKNNLASVAQILHYGGVPDEQRAEIEIRHEAGQFEKGLGVALDFVPAAVVIGLLVGLVWLSARRSRRRTGALEV